MKIFDYKFLILLGLSLVVYFIYREVEYLRNKVDKLEKEFGGKSNNIPDKIHQTILLENHPTQLTHPILPIPQNPQLNKPVLALPIPPSSDNNQVQKTEFQLDLISNENIINKSSPKVISVDMSPSKANETSGFDFGVKLTNIENKLNKSHKSNKSTNSKSKTKSNSHTQSDSESICSSSSSKHLAIYSNDNEQYDETQNSLLESIESNKLELNFDYADKPIPNIDTNVNEIINMVTASNSEKTTTISETILHESDLAFSNGSDSANSVESADIKISNGKVSNSTESELEKKKLPELKKIAELKKISLTKKVNGQQKPKNKQELINEIIQIKKA